MSWTVEVIMPNGEVIQSSDQGIVIYRSSEWIGDPQGIIAGPWRDVEGILPQSVPELSELYRTWASRVGRG